MVCRVLSLLEFLQISYFSLHLCTREHSNNLIKSNTYIDHHSVSNNDQLQLSRKNLITGKAYYDTSLVLFQPTIVVCFRTSCMKLDIFL